MQLELWPGLSGLHPNYGEQWNLPSLVMNGEYKAVRKQRTHHQPHLVLARIPFRPRLDVKPLCSDPLRQLRLHVPPLIAHDPVCEVKVGDQRLISRREIASVGDV